MRELVIPAAAIQDTDSLEVLRVWLANHQQHISMQLGIWDDPAAWGLFLCDLARHLANAYHLESGTNLDEALARIRAGFDAEMDSPTDFPKGNIVDN